MTELQQMPKVPSTCRELCGRVGKPYGEPNLPRSGDPILPARSRCYLFVHSQLVRVTKMIGISLIAMMSVCRHPASTPVTLTFLDPEWAHDLTERNVLPDERLQEFTRQTGIRVKHLPAPETALDQLGMAQELLRKGSS